MKKQKKAFPKIVGDAPLVFSGVMLNRYTTTYRAVYEVAPKKQAVVDIDEQTWLGLSQAEIDRRTMNKVQTARGGA